MRRVDRYAVVSTFQNDVVCHPEPFELCCAAGSAEPTGATAPASALRERACNDSFLLSSAIDYRHGTPSLQSPGLHGNM